MKLSVYLAKENKLFIDIPMLWFLLGSMAIFVEIVVFREYLGLKLRYADAFEVP